MRNRLELIFGMAFIALGLALFVMNPLPNWYDPPAIGLMVGGVVVIGVGLWSRRDW